MKTQSFHRLLSAVAAFMGLALFATNAVAQDYTTAAGSNTMQMTVSSQTAPALSYGVAAVLQMSQAKVSDTTIITYIQNSGAATVWMRPKSSICGRKAFPMP